jgi:hypothetical protein
MSDPEGLVRESIKVLVKDLPKIFILPVTCLVAYDHTGDISIHNFLCIVLLVCRIEGLALSCLVYSVFEIC